MSKKERIEELERRVSHLVDKIAILEDRLNDTPVRADLDYLESMIRHYIIQVEERERQRPLVAPIVPPPMPWQNPIISTAYVPLAEGTSLTPTLSVGGTMPTANEWPGE